MGNNVDYFAILLIFFNVLFNAIGALAIKYQVNKLGEINLSSLRASGTYFLKLLSSIVVLTGLVAVVIAAGLWMLALSRLNLSIAYPIATGLNFIVVVSAAILFFKESLAPKKVLALFLSLCSIFLLNTPS